MLLKLFTVLVVVFIYLHVVYHLKTCDDLEVYEMEALPDKAKLEDLCNLRQPLVFDYNNEEFMKCTPAQFSNDAFDLNVIDSSNVAVPLSVAKAAALFEKSPYYTENNADFLKDTMLRRVYEQNDFPLRPPMVALIKYDLIFGGKGATTKVKYTNHYRNYFMVVDGDVEVKLAPPRNDRFLNTQKDYQRDEFYSTMNAWDPDVPKSQEFSKVKFLTVHLKRGQTMYVPAYWWYSFKLNSGVVCAFHYKTFMNLVATLPDICIGVMQRQNTKLVVANPLLTKESIIPMRTKELANPVLAKESANPVLAKESI